MPKAFNFYKAISGWPSGNFT